MSRRCLWFLLLALWGMIGPTTFAQTAHPLEFVVFGDMPYSRSEAVDVRHLIARINAKNPAFVVHVGDIKDGSTPCTRSKALAFKRLFDRLTAPHMLTPGDNEWTDCNRWLALHGDPLKKLDELRAIFYPPKAFDGFPFAVTQQSQTPGYEVFVENLRWQLHNVVFATAHVVGSNNQAQSKWGATHPGFEAEFKARDHANRRWIAEAFATAKSDPANQAVVILMQADPKFGASAEERGGFEWFLKTLREETEAYGKPVLLIHGDSHVYRQDQPFKHANGSPLQNFYRAIVPGSPWVNALQVQLVESPGETARFSISPLIPMDLTPKP